MGFDRNLIGAVIYAEFIDGDYARYNGDGSLVKISGYSELVDFLADKDIHFINEELKKQIFSSI